MIAIAGYRMHLCIFSIISVCATIGALAVPPGRGTPVAYGTIDGTEVSATIMAKPGVHSRSGRYFVRREMLLETTDEEQRPLVTWMLGSFLWDENAPYPDRLIAAQAAGPDLIFLTYATGFKVGFTLLRRDLVSGEWTQETELPVFERVHGGRPTVERVLNAALIEVDPASGAAKAVLHTLQRRSDTAIQPIEFHYDPQRPYGNRWRPEALFDPVMYEGE